MYSKLANLVIGFHGCDESVAKKVIAESERLRNSENDYDWLGHGQYFWEQNYARALEWAIENSKQKNSKIEKPAVVGAIINLGHCLNLTDSMYIDSVKNAYTFLREAYLEAGLTEIDMPKNSNINANQDLLLRKLDCAVIEWLHDKRTTDKSNKEFDSVRGVFVEGDEIYPNSGFRTKTHIQICVRNPNCIKGYFNPILRQDDKFLLP